VWGWASRRTEESKSPGATEDCTTCMPWYLYQDSEVAAVRVHQDEMSLGRCGDSVAGRDMQVRSIV